MFTIYHRMAVGRGVLSYNIGRQTASTGTGGRGFVLFPQTYLSSSSSKTSPKPGKDKNLSRDASNINPYYDSEIYMEEEKKALAEKLSISDNDLEEKFVRGSGPGGQKINKTNNCVELKHKNTGVVIRVR